LETYLSHVHQACIHSQNVYDSAIILQFLKNVLQFRNAQRVRRVLVAQEEVVVSPAAMTNQYYQVIPGGILRDAPANKFQQVLRLASICFTSSPPGYIGILFKTKVL